MKQVLKTLLGRAIDYAGLFPPASEPMEAVVDNYASYRRGEESWMLGRLIVPVARLGAFESAARGLLEKAGDEPWRISALAGEDAAADARLIKAFNQRHTGSALVDAVEVRAGSAQRIDEFLVELPSDADIFFELPHDGGLSELLHHLRPTHGKAKLRVGGVTPDLIPEPEAVARFFQECRRCQIAFKLTAGLHHPLRGEYPLTYEDDAPRAAMHGFLNVLAAAALIDAEALAPKLAEELLVESDLEALVFEDDAIAWREHRLTADQIAAARRHFALSFGSCSFREPVEELKQLNLL